MPSLRYCTFPPDSCFFPIQFILILRRLAMWILWDSRGFDPGLFKIILLWRVVSESSAYISLRHFLVAFRLPKQLSSLGGWGGHDKGGTLMLGFKGCTGWGRHLYHGVPLVLAPKKGEEYIWLRIWTALCAVSEPGGNEKADGTRGENRGSYGRLGTCRETDQIRNVLKIMEARFLTIGEENYKY